MSDGKRLVEEKLLTIDQFESLYPTLVRLARNEVDQTRKNLDRELADWKARWAKQSKTVGRLRQANRLMKKHVRILQQEMEALRQEVAAARIQRKGAAQMIAQDR